MSTKNFILLSICIFCGGIITRYILDKNNTVRKATTVFEHNTKEYRCKSYSHKTWYGDTMLVTVDTTYFDKK